MSVAYSHIVQRVITHPLPMHQKLSYHQDFPEERALSVRTQHPGEHEPSDIELFIQDDGYSELIRYVLLACKKSSSYSSPDKGASVHRGISAEMTSSKSDEDFKYAYGWNRFNLRIIGVWPEPNEGPIMENRSWAYTALVFLIIYVPQAASVVVFWGNLNETIECLSVNVPVGISVMKLIMFSTRRKVLATLLDLMSKDWGPSRTKEEREPMLKMAKIARAISILSVSVSSSLLVVYIAMKSYYGVYERQHPPNDTRLNPGFLYPSYFPFDTEDLSRFVPTWLGQCVGTWFSMTAYSGPDSFVAMLVLHLVGQLSTIRVALINLVDDESVKNPSIYWSKLGVIVKKHEELNSYAETVNETFKAMLLVQMVVCTVTFCFQGFAMFTTIIESLGTGNFPLLNVIFFVIHGIHTIGHLFVYCYVGDLLSTESMEISFTAYDCEWYRLPPREARALMIVTNRSRVPLAITAGKFCAFSLDLFSEIMKTSMGYLSVLLAMKDRLVE